jgi:hypothetical protein
MTTVILGAILGFMAFIGYMVPCIAVFIYFGLGWAFVAFILPFACLYSSGCLKSVGWLAWYVFTAWAIITLIGWWFVLVLCSWAVWWMFLSDYNIDTAERFIF